MRARNTASVNKIERSMTLRENDSFSSRAFLINHKKRAQWRSSAAPPLFVTEDADGTVILPNLTEYKVKNGEEVMFLIIKGNMERTVAETSSNLFSSRSHAIVQFNISQHFQDTGRVLHSKVSLIDLAGSERANYMKGEDAAQRIFEGANINKSSCYIDCIINKQTKTYYRIRLLYTIFYIRWMGNSTIEFGKW